MRFTDLADLHPLAPARPADAAERAGLVLAVLHDHPHDTTPAAIARRLAAHDVAPAQVEAGLERLLGDGLVHTARGHWQLTRAGFRACAGRG